MHSWHDHDRVFLLCCHCEHTVTLTFLTISHSSCQSSNSTKRRNWYPHSPLGFCPWQTSNLYLWHTEKWYKRQAHWAQMFHLCNTMPDPSSTTLGGSSQLTEGKATPTTVLLLPYSKQDILLSCIPRHHASTMCISHTSPTFCVNPASMECRSLHTSSAMSLFSCGVNILLIKLVVCWCSDTTIHSLQVQSYLIMSGLSKLMLAGGNPQLLAETATMPLPNPSLFVG